MLFTSYQENCPLAPIEAAACGMPVVFRDIEEYKSLYDYTYLKAATTNEFIEMTKQLMTDKTIYSNGLQVSKQLITQFDKDKIREKLVSLYARLNEQVSNLYPSWM